LQDLASEDQPEYYWKERGVKVTVMLKELSFPNAIVAGEFLH